MKTAPATWFPYIGAVFFFVLTANLVGLVPLPFAEHHQLAFYAATGNLYVTLTLALFTFVFTHYAGLRAERTAHYFNELGAAGRAAGAASSSSGSSTPSARSSAWSRSPSVSLPTWSPVTRSSPCSSRWR